MTRGLVIVEVQMPDGSHELGKVAKAAALEALNYGYTISGPLRLAINETADAVIQAFDAADKPEKRSQV